MRTKLQNRILEILRVKIALTTKKIADIIYQLEHLDNYHRQVVFNELRRLQKKGYITSELIKPDITGTTFGKQFTHRGTTSREWRLTPFFLNPP